MLKRLQILVLVNTLFLCGSAFAESTDLPEPMLAEGKAWVYKNHHYDIIEQAHVDETGNFVDDNYTEIVSTVCYTLRGDTLIGGQYYYKTYRRIGEGDEIYECAMREDGRIVYQVMKGDESEIVLFDYSPEVMWKNLVIPEVTEIVDKIQVRGRIFVRHRYLDSYSYTVSVIVEGVGMDGNGLMMGSHIQYLPTCLCDYTEFDACYENGKCIFTQYDFRVESMTEGVKAASQGGCPLVRYDLQGHRLSGQPQRGGVYIQNGKKILK